MLENHEHTLFKLNLENGALSVIDKSTFGVYRGLSISPDTFCACVNARSHKVYEIKPLMFMVKKLRGYIARPVYTCPVLIPGRPPSSSRVYEHDGLCEDVFHRRR